MLLVLSGTPALADDDKNSAKSKSEAAQKAQKRVSGRVLKVDQNKNKYRVKVLQKSGRVVSVDINKKSTKSSNKKVNN
ncbi:PepSY domain-containing protein [Paraglaciecola sp. 2405UD69-4]|uniref:PepSY domain-containing protein n=1 Tax=Paraglaciecola sp. 2405UD69-4 TaxID=3391836 RepID=UPI0039C9319B